jgi:hypothetical protein
VVKYTKIFLCLLALICLFSTQRRAVSNTNKFLYLPLVWQQYPLLYASANLDGHSVIGECNPGGGTFCQCDPVMDVKLDSFANYGEVTSNPRRSNTYVNAIGFKKFTDTFPEGTPTRLGAYQYNASVRLPVLPSTNVGNLNNSQAVHLMVQLWDGRNALYPANQQTLEGAMYWNLNPWEPDYGHLKIYTYPAVLFDTGVILEPDLEWHRFSLSVDLAKQEYVRLTYTNASGLYTIDLSGKKLAKVSHQDWGADLSLNITTESMATWPQYTCPYVFYWTTQFKDLELYGLW